MQNAKDFGNFCILEKQVTLWAFFYGLLVTRWWLFGLPGTKKHFHLSGWIRSSYQITPLLCFVMQWLKCAT